MKSWLMLSMRSIGRGLASIGQGMSTFSIWPNTDYQAIARDASKPRNYWRHLDPAILKNPQKADLDALSKDWEAVGKDMRTAMNSPEIKRQEPKA